MGLRVRAECSTCPPGPPDDPSLEYEFLCDECGARYSWAATRETVTAMTGPWYRRVPVEKTYWTGFWICLESTSRWRDV